MSDEDAEGDVDVATDGSYATPTSSSPVRHEGPIVGDNSPGEPAVERLAGAGTLVPIEEVEEIPDSESDEVPEENSSGSGITSCLFSSTSWTAIYAWWSSSNSLHLSSSLLSLPSGFGCPTYSDV